MCGKFLHFFSGLCIGVLGKKMGILFVFGHFFSTFSPENMEYTTHLYTGTYLWAFLPMVIFIFNYPVCFCGILNGFIQRFCTLLNDFQK
jgi:hypothetical protein